MVSVPSMSRSERKRGLTNGERLRGNQASTGMVEAISQYENLILLAMRAACRSLYHGTQRHSQYRLWVEGAHYRTH